MATPAATRIRSVASAEWGYWTRRRAPLAPQPGLRRPSPKAPRPRCPAAAAYSILARTEVGSSSPPGGIEPNHLVTHCTFRMEDFALATVLRSATNPLTLAAALIIAAPAAQAVNFGDMFNPGRWFGNDDEYYYDEGPWGPYGPGPYGAPGYGPYGGYGYGPYGAPGYGAPAPGYGYGGPGYGAAPQTGPGQPAQPPQPSQSQSEDAKDQEIQALKRRIEELEARGGNAQGRPQPPQGPSSGEGWPSAPAFRPLDQY